MTWVCGWIEVCILVRLALAVKLCIQKRMYGTYECIYRGFIQHSLDIDARIFREWFISCYATSFMDISHKLPSRCEEGSGVKAIYSLDVFGAGDTNRGKKYVLIL